MQAELIGHERQVQHAVFADTATTKLLRHEQ